MKRLVVAGALGVLSLLTNSDVEAQSVSLKKNQVYRVPDGGPLCLFLAAKNRWVVGQRAGNKYRVARSASPSARAACADLLKPSARRGLAQLPDAAEILEASEVDGASIMAVSGTPPTFPELVAAGSVNYFWAPGVVDAIATGSPSEEQCSQFFSSSVDGASGGYGACYLTEGTSYSISEIASSGTTLCYMRNFPAAAAEDSALVDVVSGSLPGGDVRKLFNQPSGSRARVIKIQANGDDQGGGPMFIRVYSASQNAAQGNQYRVDFWACDDGEDGSPQEAQQFKLNAGGELIATSIHSHEGQRFTSTVRGFLKAGSDGLEFDVERGRSALYGGGNNNPGTERNFKSRVEINELNEIRHWLRDAMGSSSTRKGYSVSRFGGSGLTDLRFFEGAFKEVMTGEHEHQFTGATEFRDTSYVSAPDNSYVAELATIDLSSDDFYQEEITVPSISSTQFSCSQSADISITLDMSRPSMQAVAAECEANRVDGEVQFCQSEQLRTANERYSSVCLAP